MPLNIAELPGRQKYSGIYCFAPEPNNPPRLKIGMSTDLRTRLNSYHICYPDGYYIYGLLLIRPMQNRKENFKNVLSIERAYHDAIKLDNPSAHLKTDGGSIEWYSVQLDKMRDLLHKVADVYKSQVVAVYTEFDSGARKTAVRHIAKTDYEIDGMKEKDVEKLVKQIDKVYERHEKVQKDDEKKNLRRSSRVRVQPKGRLYQQLVALSRLPR